MPHSGFPRTTEGQRSRHGKLTDPVPDDYHSTIHEIKVLRAVTTLTSSSPSFVSSLHLRAVLGDLLTPSKSLGEKDSDCEAHRATAHHKPRRVHLEPDQQHQRYDSDSRR